jgi:hypothetical protein
VPGPAQRQHSPLQLHFHSSLPTITAPMRLSVPLHAHSFNVSLACRLSFASMMIFVLLYAPQAYAEWVALGNSDSGTIAYVDTSSIQPDGDHVTMWILYDFKTKHAGVGGAFFSSKVLSEYDCATARQRILVYSRFSSNMGRGSVVYGDPHDGMWAQVTPESLGQLLWRFACSKG